MIIIIIIVMLRPVALGFQSLALKSRATPNPPTNIVGFRGLDCSIMLIQRGGILMSIGKLPESLSRVMLVGTMLVGGLGVKE